MDYSPKLNLILEALCYLGLRANEAGRQAREERFLTKGVGSLAEFRAIYAPYQALRQKMDRLTGLTEDAVKPLFTDLLSDPYPTGGCFSAPMLLLLPLACCHTGDLDSFETQALACTPDQMARNILISLDLSHLLEDTDENPESVLLRYLLSSDLPKSARTSLAAVLKNHHAILEKTIPLLRHTADALERLAPELEDLVGNLTREVDAVGCETCLHETTSFPAGYSISHLRPLVFDPSTNLCLDSPAPDGSYTVYCGVLRPALRHMQIDAQATLDQIYECNRLLGDRTRFDIFCYLQNHPAYGQELSKHFGLARNTIHHHMSQMFKAGLVNCTMEGTRVYYSIDKDRFNRLLEQQRVLLLGGYPVG
mgnify:CR=1 FL=1